MRNLIAASDGRGCVYCWLSQPGCKNSDFIVKVSLESEVHLYKLAARAVWDLEATISATGAMQLVSTELDWRGNLVQHLVQDCLQL